ncbi:MAG: TolC family protein [Rickettsiaceae bacterium]|nr:TolC family protein [Rickettsiaceae bacterium]
MKKIHLLILSTLLSSGINTQALTLEEALVSSYNNNEQFKVTRSNFLADIEKFPRALSEFMPRISASSNISTININRTKDSIPSSGSDNISADTTKNTIGFSVVQPIFNGWSSVAALKSAQASFLAARSEFYKKEQDIILDTIDKYLNCIVFKEKYEIAQKSVASNKTQLEAMQEKYKQGEATITDVASSQEAYATSEANLSFALARYEASKATFTQFTDLIAEDLIMPEIPSNVAEELEQLQMLTTQQNLEIDNAKNKIIAAKADNMAAKGQLLPDVNFRIDAEKSFYTQQTSNNGNINNKRVISSLGVHIPIFAKGGAEYSDVRRSYQGYKIAIAALDATIKQINALCVAYLSEFISSKKRIEASIEAVRASELAYDGMVQEEKLGSKTIIDVLIAEKRLNDARENLADSRKAVIIAAYKIKSLTGDLTARAIKLPVEYFTPEREFHKLKRKIVSFK